MITAFTCMVLAVMAIMMAMAQGTLAQQEPPHELQITIMRWETSGDLLVTVAGAGPKVGAIGPKVECTAFDGPDPVATGDEHAQEGVAQVLINLPAEYKSRRDLKVHCF